jgi:hypothetical protein
MAGTPASATPSLQLFGFSPPEQLAQPNSGLEQLRLGRAYGCAEHSGDFAVPVAFNMEHEEHLPVPWGHLSDGTLQVEPVNRRRQLRVGSAQNLLEAEDSLLPLDDLLERACAERLPPKVHEHDVDRNPVQPCGKGRFTTEGIHLAKQLEKHLLGEVFGLRLISDHV